MAFKEVTSLDAENVVALGKKDKATGKPYPKQAEGYFLGSRTVENKRGESKIHFLQTPNGNLGLWGTTDLNRKLGQAPVGAMVRVTSTGTKSTPNGEMYTYKVEVDKDNAIEVAAAEESTSSGGSYSDEDSDSTYASSNDGSSSDDGEDEDAAQAVALAAAERRAKVQSLLNGKGKAKN